MMKLTVLVDNNTYIDRYYTGEPAVSYYIELGHKKILFDTGYSDVLINNAKKMNIDLNKVTHIILSHGHNDHTRGLKFLTKEFDMSNVALLSHPDCFAPKYDESLYIGSPYSYFEISRMMNYTSSVKPYKVAGNLIFLGEIPRVTDFEAKDPIGKIKKQGNSEKDVLRAIQNMI